MDNDLKQAARKKFMQIIWKTLQSKTESLNFNYTLTVRSSVVVCRGKTTDILSFSQQILDLTVYIFMCFQKIFPCIQLKLRDFISMCKYNILAKNYRSSKLTSKEERKSGIERRDKSSEKPMIEKMWRGQKMSRNTGSYGRWVGEHREAGRGPHWNQTDNIKRLSHMVSFNPLQDVSLL